MRKITRRSMIAAGVAGTGLGGLPLPAWLVETAGAQPAPLVRYNVASAEGQAMLRKYAEAVTRMKDEAKYPFGDPRSWSFQWYSHWLPPGPSGNYAASSAQKAELLKRVPPRFRPIAAAMWNNCQAHSSNPADPAQFQKWYFMPWHRWFVYYFEQIIQFVLADKSFTLPYWNYLSGNVRDLSIPDEFRKPASSLYRANRNIWVNAGDRIDKNDPGVLNLDAMKETIYIDSANGGIGFCPQTDNNPHGLVHDLIGNDTNMGDVATAAEDPIFWLHHCNIDRIWASWNRIPGRRNPAWPDRKFPFAQGDGKQVDVPVAGANTTERLGYRYDSYIAPPPARVVAEAQLLAAKAIAPEAAAASASAVALGNAPVRVALAPVAAGAASKSLADRSESLAPGRQIYLTVAGVAANKSPNILYNLYLDLPEGATPTGTEDPHYVGALGFFGAVGAEHDAAGHGHGLTVNITQTVEKLRANKLLTTSAGNAITFVPAGEPAAEAKPMVGKIAVTEQ
jgi:tyrosinase